MSLTIGPKNPARQGLRAFLALGETVRTIRKIVSFAFNSSN